MAENPGANARREFDVVVIGGGLVGSSLAWGLARGGQRVAVLDEGDIAWRASRGNFALVWVQSKGMGMPAYANWTVNSAKAWPEFADALERQTGLDVKYQRPGGFHVMLEPREWTHREDFLRRLYAQENMPATPYELVERDRLAGMLPHIGPDVVGASYCPLDGHCNSLRLFRALNAGMQSHGASYLPNHGVERIDHAGGEFRVHTAHGEVRAGKLVLAAGIGNARLGPMVGLNVPVRPQRGQLIVTEKTAPFLDYPIATIRQTDEGGVMIGDSQEEAGFDATVSTAMIAMLAARALKTFPLLGQLNVVRTWAALRVMTKDGFPIYDQSDECPGAFVVTCHSGVTLAAAHALTLAPLIAQGRLPAERFGAFSSRRFDVQTIE